MNNAFIPSNLDQASNIIASFKSQPLDHLNAESFCKLWSSIAFAHPGLHPDGWEDVDSGWPESLRPVALEASRRYALGSISDDIYYPSDAQWHGLFGNFEDKPC